MVDPVEVAKYLAKILGKILIELFAMLNARSLAPNIACTHTPTESQMPVLPFTWVNTTGAFLRVHELLAHRLTLDLVRPSSWTSSRFTQRASASSVRGSP